LNPTFFFTNNMNVRTPRTEFAQALKAIATERGLDADVILDTIKQAIIAAYKRDAKERGEDVDDFDFEVELDSVSGEAKVFSYPLLDEEIEDEEEDEEAEEGVEKERKRDESKKKDVTPPGFGRIAAQTAKQVIHQKIREAEKSSIMDEFSERVGSLISGTILRFDGPNVRVDLGRTEGIMPADERVPIEHLVANQRMSFLFKNIIDGPRGKQIVLSRTDPEFVKKLFAREVPEIGSGSVEIRAISREPGVRTKIAVYSSQSGVDPVGSCVGQKGVRVQAVTNELGGERVDIVSWSGESAELIKSALSPAEGLTVSLDEDTKTAKVKTSEDQLSLAIGKDGQNARLAAALTGWRIEVVGDGESVSESESDLEKKGKKPKKSKKQDPSDDKTNDKKKIKATQKDDSKKKKTKTTKDTKEEKETKKSAKDKDDSKNDSKA